MRIQPFGTGFGFSFVHPEPYTPSLREGCLKIPLVAEVLHFNMIPYRTESVHFFIAYELSN